jgi:protein subunit release factor B
VRVFSIGNVCLKEQPLPPRRVILETEIDEKFLHGSGPGGQKINKTSSAVQLKHLPTGVVIKCQHTRSRPQNRKIARQLLAEKLDDMEKGDESRSAIKQARASKKKASATKKSRRKYKKLDEAKAAVQEGSITGSLAEDASQSLPPDHIPTGEVSTDPVAKATTQPS